MTAGTAEKGSYTSVGVSIPKFAEKGCIYIYIYIFNGNTITRRPSRGCNVFGCQAKRVVCGRL
jgi:hypothetical protein